MRKALVLVFALVFTTAALASPPRARVSLRTTSLGPVLVDSRGHTLYVFDLGQGANKAVWPPFLTSAKPLATGVPAAKLGTRTLAAGKLQVTYAGHPLYFYAGDAKAGDVRGASVAHWAALSASGKPLRPASKVPVPPPTTTMPYPYDPGGGY
jgi:predicted lipoprotein with Yx(FWY)xxD motif